MKNLEFQQTVNILNPFIHSYNELHSANFRATNEVLDVGSTGPDVKYIDRETNLSVASIYVEHKLVQYKLSHSLNKQQKITNKLIKEIFYRDQNFLSLSCFDLKILKPFLDKTIPTITDGLLRELFLHKDNLQNFSYNDTYIYVQFNQFGTEFVNFLENKDDESIPVEIRSHEKNTFERTTIIDGGQRIKFALEPKIVDKTNLFYRIPSNDDYLELTNKFLSEIKESEKKFKKYTENPCIIVFTIEEETGGFLFDIEKHTDEFLDTFLESYHLNPSDVINGIYIQKYMIGDTVTVIKVV